MSIVQQPTFQLENETVECFWKILRASPTIQRIIDTGTGSSEIYNLLPRCSAKNNDFPANVTYFGFQL